MALPLDSGQGSLLQDACSVDEAKDIRDKAIAVEAYARQAKDTELQQWAGEIRLRAERRAGELLKETERAKGSDHGGRKSFDGSRKESSNAPPTLSDLGVSKKQPSQWQAVADVRALSEISVRVCDVVRKGGRILEGIAPPHGGNRKSDQAATACGLKYRAELETANMKERTALHWRAAGKLDDEKYAALLVVS